MLTSEPIAIPSSRPISASASRAALVAFPRPLDEQRGLRARAVQLCGDAICRMPGGDGLEVAAPVAVSLAGRPVGDHHDVPELCPAAVEPVVDDEAAADPRAERQHDQVGRTAAGTEPPLGESRRVPVVLDPCRQRVPRAGAIREVDVLNGKVDRAEGDTACAGRC